MVIMITRLWWCALGSRCRHTPPQFVEEIQQEVQLEISLSVARPIRVEKHSEAFAIPR
jgi:hypothetical protein